jgi:hypothetical protein
MAADRAQMNAELQLLPLSMRPGGMIIRPIRGDLRDICGDLRSLPFP